jgi:hypothetical protein
MKGLARVDRLVLAGSIRSVLEYHVVAFIGAVSLFNYLSNVY